MMVLVGARPNLEHHNMICFFFIYRHLIYILHLDDRPSTEFGISLPTHNTIYIISEAWKSSPILLGIQNRSTHTFENLCLKIIAGAAAGSFDLISE